MEEFDLQKHVFLFVLKNDRDMLYMSIFFVTPNFNSIKKSKWEYFCSCRRPLMDMSARWSIGLQIKDLRAHFNVSASFFVLTGNPPEQTWKKRKISHIAIKVILKNCTIMTKFCCALVTIIANKCCSCDKYENGATYLLTVLCRM